MGEQHACPFRCYRVPMPVIPTSIPTLERYRIDRADGFAANGPEKLVILVLKANGLPEVPFAISKMDAMLIALKLQAAASEVQAEKLLQG